MGLGIYKTVKAIENETNEFNPCPFCGGQPEWVVVGGWDYIMRCTSCHASTKQARAGLYEAKNDWNAGEIVDDNYSIATDIKIDEYLSSNINEILFEEYTPWTPFPETEDGFLCSGVDIITDSISLNFGDDFKYLHYIDMVNFGEKAVYHPIAERGCKITFLESAYENDRLLSVTLQCGENILKFFANEDEECISVKHIK